MQRADFDQWKASEVARLLALVETERRYFQDIFNVLPVAVCIVQEDLTLVAANREFRRRFGLFHLDISRSRLPELLVQPQLEPAIREVLSSGKPILRLAAPIGAPALPHHVSLLKTRNWQEGADEEVLIVLEAAEEMQVVAPLAAPAPAPAPTPAHLAADEAALAIWALDAATLAFRYINPQAWSVTGALSPECQDAVAWARQYVHGSDQERWLDFYRALRPNEPRRAISYRVIDAEGNLRWLRDEARAVCGADGRPELISVVTLDQTQQMTQAARDAESAKRGAVDRLASRVAHVANNLLMIIGGYAEELIDSMPSNDPRRLDVAEIQKAGSRLAALTSQLSLLKQPAQFEEAVIDLREWVAAAPARFTACLPAGCTCELTEAGGPAPVRGNITLLDQIVGECLRTVRPALGESSRAVFELRTRPESMGSSLRVRFVDVELGREVLANFFEPFSSPRENVPDPSIGLAALVGPLEQQGGRMAWEGAPGEPPVFVVALERAEAAELAEPALEGEGAVATEAGGTILLVEDEPGIRTLVRKTLLRQGYQVLEAGSPQEALALMHQSGAPVELLVTDLMVPGMNGRELATQLQLLQPAMRILYISGYSNDLELEAQIMSGELPPGAAFLRKPFTLGTLIEKVRELMAPRSVAFGA